MDPSPSEPAGAVAESLERDSQWLHRLARALTRDPELASDAAQTTLLRAWRAKPEGAERSWLARVLSNSIREGARSEGTRRGKEADAARPDRVEDGSLGLQRLELQRRVIDTLQGVAEPYRTTLVLRFLDGLSVRSIAARTDVKTKTVYTRIERGLGLMRERLDTRFEGGRSAWVGALLALPAADGRWASFIAGAGIMSTGTKITVGVALVAAGVFAAFQSGSDDTARTLASVDSPDAYAATENAPDPDRAEPGSLATAEDPASDARTALAEPPAEPEPAASEAPATVDIHGRVLDPQGAPLEGVGVGWKQTPAATSDRNGEFTLTIALSELPARLTVLDDDFAAARESYVRREGAHAHRTIVAAPAVALEGIVVDTAGAPLAGASVVASGAQALLQFPGVLDTTTRAEARTTSDESGRFRLERVPMLPGSYAYARSTGYDGPSVTLTPEAPDSPLRLVLEKSQTSSRPQATGTVYLPNGQPAAGATVRYGQSQTKSASDGSFALNLEHDPLLEQVLAAGLDGYAPAFVERYGELQQIAAPHAPSPVVLALSQDEHSIRGVVVDASGAPQPGWKVAFEGGLAVTRWQTPPVVLERINSYDNSIVTDEEGTFEFAGLLPREYTIRAYHAKTLLGVEPERVFAGAEELRLVVPTDAVHERLTGRITSAGGAPVEGARVGLAKVTHRTANGFSWDSGSTTLTDAEGRFELRDVPRVDIAIQVSGDHVVPAFIELDPGYEPEDQEIEVERRRHFRVEVHGTALEGLSIQVVDADETPLLIRTFTAFGSNSGTMKQLENGKMETAAVSERAAFVVLLRAGAELERRELVFVADEVCALRFDL